MALLYVDTSALVKIYIDERGSEGMRELASSDVGHRLATCSLTQVEFHSAIWRRRRVGELDGEAAKQAAELFDSQFRAKFLRRLINDWTLDLASELAARRPLRAYDAVQLASCLAMEEDMREPSVFISADRQLLAAAKAEGLSVLDPTEEEEPPALDSAEGEEPPLPDPADAEG